MDFNTLKDYPIAVGAAINTPEDVAALKAARIHAILDLRAEYDDNTLLAKSGLIYLWNGVNDDGQPKPDSWWEANIVFADKVLSGYHPLTGLPLNEFLYCHCAAGINRGPSAAYGILRALWGLSPEDAEKVIRDVRPQVGIAYKNDFERFWKTVGKDEDGG